MDARSRITKSSSSIGIGKLSKGRKVNKAPLMNSYQETEPGIGPRAGSKMLGLRWSFKSKMSKKSLVQYVIKVVYTICFSDRIIKHHTPTLTLDSVYKSNRKRLINVEVTYNELIKNLSINVNLLILALVFRVSNSSVLLYPYCSKRWIKSFLKFWRVFEIKAGRLPFFNINFRISCFTSAIKRIFEDRSWAN